MVAILFTALIAVSVGSFLKLAGGESRLANIAFHSNGSLNLAEGGVEKALYAINREAWSGWTVSGNTAEFNGETVDLGDNITGTIRARITGMNGSPVIFAEGAIQVPGRPAVVKQVEVRLGRRSLFANGITARDDIRFNGNVEVDSYRSGLGPPSYFNRNDNGSVASASVAIHSVELTGNSEIWGRVATGGAWPKTSPNVRIHGEDTPRGVKIDPGRVALDFASDFPEIAPPTTYDEYRSSIDVRGNNKSATLGVPGATEPTVIRMESISVGGNGELTIVGPVIVHLLGDLNLSGNGEIVIPDNGRSSLVLYIDGDFHNGGNGAFNESTVPANLVVYGTNPVYQTIHLGGNADWQAVVYAPNADIHFGGNVDMAGAVVGNRIRGNGNFDFHYDEDLGDFGSDGSYRMVRWRELHLAEERVAF